MIHHYNPITFILKGEHMTTLFKKGLVFAVIVLFIGAGVVPSISSVEPMFGITLFLMGLIMKT